jgi:hypothetical protein
MSGLESSSKPSGDGIMAFFGYKDTDANDNGRKGAISAVKAG